MWCADWPVLLKLLKYVRGVDKKVKADVIEDFMKNVSKFLDDNWN